MAQVTIRLTLTEAEYAKEVIEADVEHNRRVATDDEFARAMAGVLDTNAYKRHAAQRVLRGEAVLKEFG